MVSVASEVKKKAKAFPATAFILTSASLHKWVSGA